MKIYMLIVRMRQGLYDWVASRTKPMKCNKCEFTGYSKQPVNIIDLIILLLLIGGLYWWLKSFFVLIVVPIGLAYLIMSAKHRCPKCFTEDIQIITEDEFETLIQVNKKEQE